MEQTKERLYISIGTQQQNYPTYNNKFRGNLFQLSFYFDYFSLIWFPFVDGIILLGTSTFLTELFWITSTDLSFLILFADIIEFLGVLSIYFGGLIEGSVFYVCFDSGLVPPITLFWDSGGLGAIFSLLLLYI